MNSGYYYLKKKSNCMWIYIFIGVFILFWAFQRYYRSEFFTSQPKNFNEPEEKLTPPIFDGKCDPACCLQSQWPVDFMSSNINFAEYEQTGLSCRGCNGVGCLCQRKKKVEPIF